MDDNLTRALMLAEAQRIRVFEATSEGISVPGFFSCPAEAYIAMAVLEHLRDVQRQNESAKPASIGDPYYRIPRLSTPAS